MQTIIESLRSRRDPGTPRLIRCGARALWLAALALIGPLARLAVAQPSDWADAPRVIKDIAPAGSAKAGSEPSHFVSYKGNIYCIATDAGAQGEGRQLWRIDASARRAEMVVNANPPPDPMRYSSEELFEMNGRLIFSLGDGRLFATDGTASGTEEIGPAPEGITIFAGGYAFFNPYTESYAFPLWRTDGTRAGTIPLGPEQCRPRAELGGKLLLGVYDIAAGGQVPWMSDGTPEGTHPLVDSNAGLDGLTFEIGNTPPVFGGLLYFRGINAAGSEPWVTDGTSEGTRMLADIAPGAADSLPNQFFPALGSVFFQADENDLWKSDGTPEGTSLVRPLFAPMSYVHGYSESYSLENGILLRGFYFGQQMLWISDGATSGTQPLEVTPDGSEAYWYFVEVNGKAVFAADGGASIGWELFVCDGSAAGTGLLADIAPGAASGAPSLTTAAGGIAYFSASTPPEWKPELWRTDGTPGGTIRLATIKMPVYRDIALIGEIGSRAILHFAGKVMTSDGTPEGTIVLGDGSSWNWKADGEVAELDGKLVFTGTDASAGDEPWVTNGTPGGTYRLADIARRQIAAVPPSRLAPWFGGALFAADDAVHGLELWKSDGSAGGTSLVADVFPGPDSSDPKSIVGFRGKGYFSAVSPFFGPELWSSDGTPSGIELMRDLRDGGSGANPGSLTVVEDRLLFIADDGLGGGQQIWSSDGTAAGIVKGSPFGGTLDGNDPNTPLEVFAGQAYFRAGYGGGLSDLSGAWRTRDAATYEQIYHFASSAFKVLGGDLVFFPEPSWFGGADLVRYYVAAGEAATLASFARFDAIARLGDQIYCLGSVGTEAGADIELWKSGGTIGTTQRVAVIGERIETGLPLEIHAVEELGLVFFPVFTRETGRELWVSDGTAAGTHLAWDLWPGPQSSFPAEVIAAGDRLYFTADDPVAGREVWSAPLGALGAPSIARHPASQSIRSGDGIVIAVEAEGAAPLAYQWEKDGLTYTGATSSMLPLSNAQAASAGRYRCRVTDANGRSAASRVATLRVDEPGLFDAAALVRHTLPAEMTAGSLLVIGVTMQNTSGLSWSQPQGYRLAVLLDPADTFWGTGSYLVPPPPEIVPPGGTATFVMGVAAPETPGTYTAKLRMMNSAGEAFGQEVGLTIRSVPPRNAAAEWTGYE